MREEVHTADGSPQAGDPPLHDKVDGAPTTTAMGPVESMGFAAGSLQGLHSPTALTSESIRTASLQLQVGPYTDVPPCQEAEASPRSDIIHVCETSTGQLNCECQKPLQLHRSTTLDLIQHSLSDGPSGYFDAPSIQTPGSRQRCSTKSAVAESYATMRSACNQSAEQLATRFIGTDTDQDTLHNRRFNSISRDDNCIGKQQPLGETSIPDRPTPSPSTLISTTASSCSSLASSPKFGRRGRHLSMLQNSSGTWTSNPDLPSCQPQFSSHQTRRYSQLRRSRSLPSSVSSSPACFAEHDEDRYGGSFGRVDGSPLVPSVPGPGCINGSSRPSYSGVPGAMNASPISSAFTDPHPSLLRPPVTRSRGRSLLSPAQLHALRRKLETKAVSINDSGFGKGALGYLGQKISKGGKQRISDSHDGSNLSNISANSAKTRCEQGKKQSPLTCSTPVLVFQPHDTEISTSRPSVSGRLLLLVPQMHGQRFQFVSLVLHLRLKESITWTRQDLISFEIEKEHWAQTIWEKKVMLPFQDRQVEEGLRHGYSPNTGLSSAAAVVASTTPSVPTMLSPFTATDRLSPQVANMVSQPSVSTKPRSASDINRDNHAESLPSDTSVPIVDAWRWEWLIPVTKHGARPESFEGAMGMVWYELEAKCLFRWDKIDENGQVISVGNTHSTVQAVDTPQALKPSNRSCSMGQVKSQLGSIKLLKGLGATTNTAKSIANVFGKLRAGNRDGEESKGKKTPHAVGDFVLGTQHDEYMKESIKKSQQAATAAATAAAAAAAATTALTRSLNGDQNGVESTALFSAQKNTNPNGVDGTRKTRPSEIPEPIPFLVRKVIKLHFNRPPQGPSSSTGYFLPPPTMSLPTLPRTRRLKAIIPGAKIQVQIQVPSVIPIPGYAQTSLLVPSSKTGGLVSKVKRCDGGGDPGLLGTGTAFRDQYIGHCVGKDAKVNQPPSRLDPRYPDSFQVALTIRKVTTHDINRSDILRRRYENAEVAAKTVAKHTNSSNREKGQGLPRTRLSSGTCAKSNQPNHESAPGSGTVPCELNRADAVTRTTPNLECKEKYENAGKACRREIRVRKIKCEFWQKESCRIPTDDAPSRSVKVPLAPVFIYSEKEHEKERIREMAAYNQNPARCSPFDPTDGAKSLLLPPQGLAISTTRICDDGGMSAPIFPAAMCATTTDGSHNPLPLKPPPRLNAGERKGSLGSIFSTSLQRSTCSAVGMRPTSVVLNPSYTYPSPGTNHPFMMLIPVPLDSPKLRQTYDWPSSNMPAPTIPSAYDYAMPNSLISETGLGQGSECDSTSQSTTYDAGETASHGYISPTLANTSAVKARIVVKHHLNFRLSIDVFEYEGEFEQEDMDLEAIEDQQLQRARGRQALSLRTHSGPTVHSDLGFQDLEEHYSNLEETVGSGRLKGGTEEQHAPTNKSAVASRISPLPFELTDVNELNGNSAHHHTQPALPLFNMAAGLLDLDQDDGRLLQKPPSLGLTCALPSQRRGSQGSLETTGSSYSSSSGTANSASLLGAQTCNNVSGTGAGGGSALHPLADASSGGGGDGGGESGGLMAEAIGALKKTASFSGLAHALGTTATSLAAHHPRQQPSQASSNQSRVDVRKLKDFVIRVPITVVIQVDEQGRAAGAHGTTGSCSDVHCEDIGQKDVASTLLRRSHATHEETSASGSAATINLATPARSVVIEPSAGMREPKFTGALESTEALSCLSKIATPIGASSNLTRSDEVVASPSVLHWHDGLWPEQENDQHVSSLEHADEEFSDDFIVVDAEEVDGDEL